MGSTIMGRIFFFPELVTAPDHPTSNLPVWPHVGDEDELKALTEFTRQFVPDLLAEGMSRVVLASVIRRLPSSDPHAHAQLRARLGVASAGGRSDQGDQGVWYGGRLAPPPFPPSCRPRPQPRPISSRTLARTRKAAEVRSGEKKNKGFPTECPCIRRIRTFLNSIPTLVPCRFPRRPRHLPGSSRLVRRRCSGATRTALPSRAMTTTTTATTKAVGECRRFAAADRRTDPGRLWRS